MIVTFSEDPGLTWEWNNSQHGQSGVNCLDCHAAEPGDNDGWKYEGQLISIIVTPKDCSKCHQTEFEEMDGSHHSKGGQILASLDNLLGEVVGGPAAVNAGCRQCHGAVIEIGEDGKPTPTTWPNTGIGRINPDGSTGSCNACHGRHRFSKAQARTPDTCGKCHVGPDHPQIEVYNESKHGIIYRAMIDEMNLQSDKWVAGVDYSAAPTCATCHMSAGGKEGKTHNVGDRISWTLRPPISQKINLVRLENGDEFDVKEGGEIPNAGDVAKGSTVVEVVTWQERRKKMQEVCRACHSDSVIEGHYNQFDNVVELYNEKFAKPIAAVMGELKKAGYTTPYFRFLALLMVVTGGIHGVHAADELNSLLERGQKQLDAGQLDETLASYQQAVQNAPNSSLAYTRLGGTRLLRQEYGDSITDFQQAIMLDQTNAGAFLGMAMAYLHLGRYELARQSLNEAERLDPSKKAEISKVRTWLDSRSDSPPH